MPASDRVFALPIFILPLLAPLAAHAGGPTRESQLNRDRIAQVKRVVLEGREYRLYKYAAEGGDGLVGLAFDPDSNRVDSLPAPARRDSKADAIRLLRKAGGDGKVKVILVPRIEADYDADPQAPSGSDHSLEALSSRKAAIYRLNGAPADLPAIEALQSGMEKAGRERYDRHVKMRDLHGKRVLAKHPALSGKVEGGRGDALVLTLSAQELEYLANHPEDFEAVEEYVQAEPDFDGEVGRDFFVAYNNSGLVNVGMSNQGSNVSVYLTEAGSCPDAGWLSNYTKLSGSVSVHVKFTSAILRAATPLAKIQCGAKGPEHIGFSLPAGTHIMTGSYSYKRATNTYTTSDRDWDNFVYNTGVAAFNSGSNTGAYGECDGSTSDCHQVASPAKGHNVLHVGNSSNITSPENLHYDSPWRNPDIYVEKPDFVTNGGNYRPFCLPTDCKDYKNYQTSGATPFAAGIAADVMSSKTQLKLAPEWLRAHLIVGATNVMSDNNCPDIASLAFSDCNVGPGGLRLENSLNSFGKDWRGSDNAAFTRFDATAHGDQWPGNGTVDWTVQLDASSTRTRIALTWLTRGSYTYGHVNDESPIGTDYDLTIFDPDGSFVKRSTSWDNSMEMVEFDPQKTGAYRISISRYANRDTGARTIMAVATQSW